MGQYHYVMNLDRKEFLYPHKLGDGLKLREFGESAGGTMTALAILLAGSVKGGARGGGDFQSKHALAGAIVGRWAGDRIAIVGDYSETGDVRVAAGDPQTPAEWRDALDEKNGWVDVSSPVREVMESGGVAVRPPWGGAGEDPMPAYDASADRFA